MMAKKGPKDSSEKDKKGKESFDQLLSTSMFKVKKTKGGNLKITRKFTPPKIKKPKKKEKGKEKFNQELEQAFMNMLRFRYEIFVPTEVIETNATQVFGKDLRWETTLGYLLKSPFEINVEIQGTPELVK